MNDFDDFQKQQKEVYSTNNSLEYLTLKLVSHSGRIASEVAFVARGDYESKGAFVYEGVIEHILDECNAVMRQVALITTVLEKKLSDVILHHDGVVRRSNEEGY